MTNPQEERTNILKGCGKQFVWIQYLKACGRIEDLKHSDNIILCLSCKARLSQHDKTMKLVMEEIDKFIKEHKECCEDEKHIVAIGVLTQFKKSLGGQK